jgi:hypothetical protein
MITETPRLEITFNPNRFATIIDSAVLHANEIVNFHVRALDGADLSQPMSAPNLRFQLQGPAMDAAARRTLHENWILARAFQELIRAVRQSLEDAHVFVTLLSKPHRISSNSTLADFLHPFQTKAGNLPFGDLVDKVNGLLRTQLKFTKAYKSFQSVRNCLEHRNGIVGRREVGHSDAFYLIVPYLKTFYMRGDAEIELEAGHQVEPGDDRDGVDVFARWDERERKFALGERIAFTLQQFNEVTFACHQLGAELTAGLPKPLAADARAV